MRDLAMTVRRGAASQHKRLPSVARIFLAITMAWLSIGGLPAAAQATAQATAQASAHRPGLAAAFADARPATGQTKPLMCRPEPPDYPGCSAAQVRPLLKARFASEYTGHAEGYRYYRMGQHHRRVIFEHLTQTLNTKLARLYHAAVTRYAAAHTSVVVDGEGVTHVVVSYPRYTTWAGFRSHTTAFCNGTNLTVHFPTQYCWSITKLGQAGRVINSLLDSTTRIAFSCNGFAIGGWASGSYAAWKMGTGVLAGGYYGAVGVEIGCQTTNLWNWASHLW